MKDIARDELYQLFVVEGKTRKEIAEHFNVKPYVIDNYTKRYGIRRESQQEVLDRIKSLYSVEDIRELYSRLSHPELAQTLGVTADVLNVLLKDYGLGKRSLVKNLEKTYTKEVLEDLYITQNKSLGEMSDLLKTGGLNVRKMLRAYGITKPGHLRYENIQKTWLDRYGTTNINEVPEVDAKRRKTCLERYGAECYLISQQCYSEFRNDSKPNRRFAKLLLEHGIDHEREFPVGSRSYDFKIGNKLVEINPYATHNSTWGIGKDKKGKEPRYHRDKTELARENGYQCIHVFDWDDWDKVIKLLLPKQTLYARKLELREVQQLEANRFLKEHHLQGGAKLQTVCLGLFQGQELMEVMTFGKPRFNRNYQWELIRLCTRSGYCVVGGAERLFKAFIKLQQPDSIISYCDDAKFNGNVYTRLGFIHQSTGAISKHWFNPETGTHITDNGLRMKGFDKLLGGTYGKFGKGTSNENLMREHGFVEVYDAGQSVYTWQSQPNPIA